MAEETLRIGVVGAGDNTRKFHIPRLQEIDGVEVVSVANRQRRVGRTGGRAARLSPRCTTLDRLVAAEIPTRS